MRVQLIQEPFSQRFAVFPRELEWKAGNGYREVGGKLHFFFFWKKMFAPQVLERVHLEGVRATIIDWQETFLIPAAGIFI